MFSKLIFEVALVFVVHRNLNFRDCLIWFSCLNWQMLDVGLHVHIID
jgi:hypothetical protein